MKPMKTALTYQPGSDIPRIAAGTNRRRKKATPEGTWMRAALLSAREYSRWRLSRNRDGLPSGGLGFAQGISGPQDVQKLGHRPANSGIVKGGPGEPLSSGVTLNRPPKLQQRSQPP